MKRYHKKTKEKIARLMVTCWMSIIAADRDINEEELVVFQRIASTYDFVKDFDWVWVQKHCLETMQFIQDKGILALMERTKPFCKGLGGNEKSQIYRSCLEIGCADKNFSNEEVLAVQRVADILHMRKGRALMETLFFLKSKIS